MIAPETINKMADYIQISYNFLDSKRIRSSYEDQEYLKLHELVTLISGKRYAQVRWDALEEFEKEMWDKRKDLGLLDSGSIHDDAAFGMFSKEIMIWFNSLWSLPKTRQLCLCRRFEMIRQYDDDLLYPDAVTDTHYSKEELEGAEYVSCDLNTGDVTFKLKDGRTAVILSIDTE
jgi:hypothetical protein